MKPSDFMIGLISFLAILLPGAIATALFLGAFPGAAIFANSFAQHDAFKLVLAFAVSYIAGHLIYLVGSWLDPTYDFVRRIRDPYSGAIATGDNAPHPLWVFLFRKRNWGPKSDKPKKTTSVFIIADRLRRKVMSGPESSATHTFQWCRAILIQKNPGAHRDIETHEADQKLFRSLVVLSLAVSVYAVLNLNWLLTAIALLTAAASFMRFYNRRLKTVSLAYTHIITMYRCGDLTFLPIETTAKKS
ncbi:phage holin family protein [Erythrobacter crassostreae]|uniref:Glycosyl-4,4'-diaponeurosporenoate acyltransferase n=1 Tax=Erythrobacter crassostreae TaxID=2828328 RepID=A0A9X1JLX4_9SPHN|nr:phage holin family protein [Erythrobacter crassostrea]MBV7258218.1 hypothetical protein [Erythrobacter crassostrea]